MVEKTDKALTACLFLEQYLKRSRAKGTAVNDLSLMFIDLAKAFDKVPHDLLWSKLGKMGFNKQFTDLLKSLYKDSYVTIIVNGHKTDKIMINSGVKQGFP